MKALQAARVCSVLCLFGFAVAARDYHLSRRDGGGLASPLWLKLVHVACCGLLLTLSFMSGGYGFYDRPRGPLWLPRGLRFGAWSGGALLPMRPPALMRPTHPSWSLPGPAFEAASPTTCTPTPTTRPSTRFAVSRLTTERAAKRAREDGNTRDRAMAFLADFILKYKDVSVLATTILEGGEAISSTSPSLVAVLESRKTATLVKRASSLRLYEAWFATTGQPTASLFAERAVFEHMNFLNAERVGATRGMALMHAINFAGGLFGFNVKMASGSARVRGLVVRLLKTRQPLRQRAPLSVPMVAFLENLATTTEDDEQGIFAGAALFCVYARARVGDLRRSEVDPILDSTAGMDTGFIQGAFYEHKTAAAGSKISVPIVAPVPGIVGTNWASSWLERRQRQRLRAATSGTLLPAPAAGGGWTVVPMKTVEFGVALRGLLLGGGFTSEDLKDVGAHSLKATTLSWMAKAGVDKDTRRALGGIPRQS